jgi:hypothetical protein
MGSYAEQDETVCSFGFADFRHDGNLTLVAGSDSSGRMLCSEVYIVDKTASGFETYGAAGGEGPDVSSNIMDVRRDGNLEYVADWVLGTLRARCIASWPVIYAWSDSGYRNVSDRFKDFYRQQLDSLNKTISAIPSKRHPYDTGQKECLLAEAAQIQRFPDASSKALLDQAIRLTSSKDPAERAFAADLFGDIGPQAERKYLEILAKDSNRGVADEGKYFLSGPSSKGPIRPPDEFQRIW